MSEEEFSNKLAGLLSAEAARARREPARYAAMIERLAAGLGFTIAMAAEGDGALIDKLIAGAEAHAHQEAVEKADFAKTMATLSRGFKGSMNG